ncbi:MAG: PIG-L family deacetylase [Alphaproteobacteria bacterium]|nr:PIG-L family deacetylase [Alphaproteobacteria bacterium]
MNREQTNQEIIISMTSFPQRIANLKPALASIFSQTIQPDRIILWLADSQFPKQEKDLPSYLLRLVKKGKICIEWCNDLRPHKKYFYAMKKYPDSIIITVDDDLIYESTMVESLLISYQQFPRAISALRTHLMIKDENNKLLPYGIWPKETNSFIGQPSMQLLATNGAGALFPPHLLNMEYLQEDIIKNTALNADDLWLKAVEVLSDIPVVQAAEFHGLKTIKESQEFSLWSMNKTKNDDYLKDITDWVDNKFGEGYFMSKIFDTNIGNNFYNIKDICLAFSKKYNKKNPHNTMTSIYFIPHQDDELLTMGIDICSSIIKKQDVHVVLCTDGSESSIKERLNDQRHCPLHKEEHKYCLTKEEFTQARDQEFINSCLAMGVQRSNIHIPFNRVKDGKLSVTEAEKFINYHILQYQKQSKVIINTIYYNTGSKQHSDHKALGMAANNLFKQGKFHKIKFFIEPYCLDDCKKQTRKKVADKNIISKIKQAVNAYKKWNPGNKQYAIGYHSMKKEFDKLIETPQTSYIAQKQGLIQKIKIKLFNKFRAYI